MGWGTDSEENRESGVRSRESARYIRERNIVAVGELFSERNLKQQ
ncbi:hypothetical protein V0288_24855 [Pannus brasiliensis CCIBt3594]|uniref:Uncharacterized protein n=1 Tax=Pannus brasiliensis CCIBt3594 TaxID=1427578 RepID=A0AAW9QV62_9CHRO